MYNRINKLDVKFAGDFWEPGKRRYISI